MVVGDVIVATLAHGDAVEQAVADVQRLPKLQHPVLVAGEPDAERLAHEAAAAVAADQIVGGDGGRGPFRSFTVAVTASRPA